MLFLAFLIASCAGKDLDLSKVTVVYDGSDHPLAAQMAQTLADDIERVSGVRPKVAQGKADGPVVVLGTAGQSSLVDDVDALSAASDHIDIEFMAPAVESDEITLCISTVPMWPVYDGRSNSFGVSVDGCAPVKCENRKDYVVTLPLDQSKRIHTLSFHIGDPGQMIQKVTYR